MRKKWQALQQREMEIMDSLNEVKQLNKRLSRVDNDQLLKETMQRQDDQQLKEEEQVLASGSKGFNGGLSQDEMKKRFMER